MPQPVNPLLAARPPAHWTSQGCAAGRPGLASAFSSGTPLTRRHLLKGIGGAGLLLGGPARTAGARAHPTPSPVGVDASPVSAVRLGASPAATPGLGGLLGFAFNAKGQDVTLFDPATSQALGTKPLGATVRWLSNQQRFWDGHSIWTYDFPDNRVYALAIDPVAVRIVRTIPTRGVGPAHSLMLTPDRATAWVNTAGDNVLAAIDVASGQMIAQVATGKFPWDLHLTPDGRFGFTPERDQDTVCKFDLATRRIVQTVAFPAGSKPYMLRVTPDGAHVWVQTVGAQTNIVLEVDTMTRLQTTPTGRGPVQSAFGPPGGRYGLVTHGDDTFVLVLDQATGRAVTRIEVGKPQANACFTSDGATAFVTVTGGDEVVAIDMTQLTVIGRIPTGGQPMGLALLDPTAP